MSAGKGRTADKTKGRFLDEMLAIKKRILEAKAAFMCLFNVLIAMAR